MNREQLMKMSKKELKARLVALNKEAQDKGGEELNTIVEEANTIGEILDEIKARENLAAAASAAEEGEEPGAGEPDGEGNEPKDQARAKSGRALKDGKKVTFAAKVLVSPKAALEEELCIKERFNAFGYNGNPLERKHLTGEIARKSAEELEGRRFRIYDSRGNFIGIYYYDR